MRQRQSNLTYFSGAVNVVDVEDGTEAVEQDFGERRNQLRCSHQHVNTRRPDNTHRIYTPDISHSCQS